MLSLEEHTLVNQDRDFVEWHRGRGPYVLWAIDLDRPAVRDRLRRAADHLQPWLLPGYRRQAHLTLALCGFPAEPPRAADEFSLAALRQRLAGGAWPAPFEIRLGGLESFSSAPFLTVDDPTGGIAALRRGLGVAPGRDDPPPYVPHVTVGLYAVACAGAQVRPHLASFDDVTPLPCPVERLTLMAYRPAEVGGPLRALAEVCLRSGEQRWLD